MFYPHPQTNGDCAPCKGEGLHGRIFKDTGNETYDYESRDDDYAGVIGCRRSDGWIHERLMAAEAQPVSSPLKGGVVASRH